MHLINVDLSHQHLLTEKFRALNLELSEYTFANIYLFRHIHHYQLLFEKELFVKGTTYDGYSYLMPTFSFEKHVPIYEIRLWLSEVDFLFPIPEHWLTYFDPTYFQFTFSENDSDYLMSTEKMGSFSGRHLSPKRNLVKQLLSQHQVEVFPLTLDNVSHALDILETWQQEQELNKEKNDYFPCREALQLLGRLPLTGHLFYVDGVPSGFVLGELTPTNYCTHFTKAKKSIKGLYQYLYQALANALTPSCPFINLEQDLGVPQVRQAKHSYHPDRIVPKWRVQLKQ